MKTDLPRAKVLLAEMRQSLFEIARMAEPIVRSVRPAWAMYRPPTTRKMLPMPRSFCVAMHKKYSRGWRVA